MRTFCQYEFYLVWCWGINLAPICVYREDNYFCFLTILQGSLYEIDAYNSQLLKYPKFGTLQDKMNIANLYLVCCVLKSKSFPGNFESGLQITLVLTFTWRFMITNIENY
jgi:hypothetical protein